MEHGSHLVDTLDENGTITGQKPRRDIDKTRDIYHSVHIFMITPKGEVVLQKIPSRDDLPNIYADLWGAVVATIRRHDETADQAAIRAITRELFIDDAEVHFLGEKFYALSDGHKTLLSAYYLVADLPETYSHTDLGTVKCTAPRELTKQLHEDPTDFAPTLQAMWQDYADKLPV